MKKRKIEIGQREREKNRREERARTAPETDY